MGKIMRQLLPFIGYGLLAAVVLFLLQLGRDYFMLSLDRIDLWISSIAVVFVIAGFLLGIWVIPTRQNNHMVQQAMPEVVLSKRETEVLQLLVKNMSNKEICAALFIENSTLKTHINKIYKKMDVQNRQELIARCEIMQTSISATAS